MLTERFLHGLPRDFLVTLRNEHAIVDRQDDDVLVDASQHSFDHDLASVVPQLNLLGSS